MARNQIKLGADVSSIKRSIADISRTIDTQLTRKQSVKLFDPETRKFLSEEAGRALKDLQVHMDKLNDQSKQYKTELKDSTKSMEEQNRIRKELLRIEEQRIQTQKSMTKLQQDQQFIQGGAIPGTRGRGGGFLGRAAGAVGGVPILGGLMRGIAAMGPLGLLAAGGAAVGGFAISRGMQGYQSYRQNLEIRQALRARGVTGVSGRSNSLADLGFGASEVNRAQMSGMDVFGRRGIEGQSGADSALQTRLAFSRFAGIDPERLSQTFAGTQTAGGFNQAQRVEAEFMGVIISDELESAIGPYLEASASLLEQINKDGISLTAPALQSLAAIAKEGDVFSPQQVARTLGNLDQTIRGAQGDQAAFFMTAFARQGIGGGTFGGAEAAMRGGLFGADLDRLKEMGIGSNVLGAYQRLGIGDTQGASGPNSGPARRISGIVKSIEQFTQNMVGVLPENATKEQRQRFEEQKVVAEDMFASRILNTQDPVKAREGLMLLKTMETALNEGKEQEAKTAREQLEELMKDPETSFREKLENLTTNIDGNIQSLEANQENILNELGQRVVPIVSAIKTATLNMDKGITYLAKEAGMVTEEEKRANEIVKSREIGTTKLQFEEMSEAETLSEMESIKLALEQAKKDRNSIQPRVTNFGGSINLTPKQQEEKLKLDVLISNLNGYFQSLIQKQEESNTQLKTIAGETRRNNRGIGSGKKSSVSLKIRED